MPTNTVRWLVRGLAGLAIIGFASGFAYLKNTTSGLPIKWPPGTIPERIMVDNVTVLGDGNTRATSIVAAMQQWNTNLGDAQFSWQVLPVGTGTDGNSGGSGFKSEIFFDSAAYGMAFDSTTLAVTTAWYSSNQRLEADTIFNNSKPWDSYRGARRASVDIQRVALHELGHALGLDHPDEAGQSVSAIMNSHISDLDALQFDDISGAQTLYGPPGVPANNNFAGAYDIGVNSTFLGIWTNTNATKEPGEPNHAGNIGGRSVWFKWLAPGAGTVTATTSGSVFDTTLGVYVGPAVNALTLVASNDDVQSGVIQSSAVTFPVTGGITYYFAVDGFNSNDGHGADSGEINLDLTFNASGTTTTTTTTSTIGSSSTTTTIPPTSGGGGGGGGAFGSWSYVALALLSLLRWRLKKT